MSKNQEHQALELARQRLHAGIDAANLKREKLRQASDNTSSYSQFGDGIYLFKAFMQWRDATSDERLTRRREILDAFESPEGVPLLGFEALTNELLAQNILDRLEPIIGDLLDFCESKLETNAQLTALRDALRIGRFHAPSDTKTKESKIKCVSAWISEYGAIERTAVWQSETAIARGIEKRFKGEISYKTALIYWHDFLRDNPWQTQWLEAVLFPAKLRKNAKKPRIEKGPRKRLKPPSWR